MTDEKIVGTIEGPREYMAGERVSCVVTMRPPEKCAAQTEVSNFVLSAVAVQIVGVFTYNPQWCAVPYVAPTPREVNVLFAPVLPTLGLLHAGFFLPRLHVDPSSCDLVCTSKQRAPSLCVPSSSCGTARGPSVQRHLSL